MYPQAGDERFDEDNAKLRLQGPLESIQLCKYDRALDMDIHTKTRIHLKQHNIPLRHVC